MSLDTGLTRDTRTSFPYCKPPPKVLIGQAFEAEEWERFWNGLVYSLNKRLLETCSILDCARQWGQIRLIGTNR